jgi:hypothetical protein
MRYFYLRNRKGFPVGCVASDKFPMGNGLSIIRFGVSSYNPIDKFNKTQAKIGAQNRINEKGPYIVVGRPEWVGHVKETIMVAISYKNMEGVSHDSREAAKLWLKRYNLDSYLRSKSGNGTSNL